MIEFLPYVKFGEESLCDVAHDIGASFTFSNNAHV